MSYNIVFKDINEFKKFLRRYGTTTKEIDPENMVATFPNKETMFGTAKLLTYQGFKKFQMKEE